MKRAAGRRATKRQIVAAVVAHVTTKRVANGPDLGNDIAVEVVSEKRDVNQRADHAAGSDGRKSDRTAGNGAAGLVHDLRLVLEAADVGAGMTGHAVEVRVKSHQWRKEISERCSVFN